MYCIHLKILKILAILKFQINEKFKNINKNKCKDCKSESHTMLFHRVHLTFVKI
ncbi:hypothetical protein CKA32_005384 [Geitlerinema sp. FC II]|nr:hypothetical protein CKA32_005384 [Geitlerinema sp. FC II]